MCTGVCTATHTHTETYHTYTHLLEGRDMPYVVTCKIVILQLQLVDKDEMLRIADDIQVKNLNNPVHVVYQKLVTMVTSWYDFILSNIYYIMAKNLLRYQL